MRSRSLYLEGISLPVEFLSRDQENCYGRFAGEPTEEQLARYFHVDDADRARVYSHYGDHNRLGYALQLGTVRFLGTFLPDPTDAPKTVIHYMAAQLGISDPSIINRYRTGRSLRNHTAEIQRQYGYRHFSSQPEHFRLVRWLYTCPWRILNFIIIMPPWAFGTGPDNAVSIGKPQGERLQEQDDPLFQKGFLRSTRNEPAE